MYVHGPVGNKAPAKRRTFGGGRVNCAVPTTAPGFLSMRRSNPQISSVQESVSRPQSIQIHLKAPAHPDPSCITAVRS